MSNPAPAARQLWNDANRIAPGRNKASDGIVPSAAHSKANPYSDHEVGRAGYNHAVDLTHDPSHGCDCDVIAARIVASGDDRWTYIIRNRRIIFNYGEAGSKKPLTWYAYTGSNPHTGHMHMSLKDTKAACTDTKPWAVGATTAKPTPTQQASSGSRTTTDRLNMRTDPGTHNGIILTIPQGKSVTYYGQPTKSGAYTWVKVGYAGLIGWVADTWLSGPKAEAAFPYSATTKDVNTNLNIRSGPGTGYKVTRSLPKGAKFKVYSNTPGAGSKTGWDNVGTRNGQAEYVAHDYVRKL